MTSNDVSDAAVVADMLKQVPADEALRSLTGDGAYDTQAVYEALRQRGCTPIIPRERTHEYAKAMPLYRNGGYRRMPAFRPKDMESVERLSPAQLGRNQNELHQTAGRTAHVQNL